MKDKLADLKSLIDGNPEDREEISLDALNLLTSTTIEIIEEAIALELHAMTLEALKNNDFFWREKQLIGKDDNEKYGYFGSRVRLKDEKYLHIGWFKAVPSMQKSRAMLNHIKKGSASSLRYSMNHFKNAGKKEFEAIRYVEDEYTKIRERYNVLNQLRQNIKRYKKLLQENSTA